MLFEKSKQSIGLGERVLLLYVQLAYQNNYSKSEFLELAKSSGTRVIHEILIYKDKPNAHSFIGRGKVAKIEQLVSKDNIEAVICSQTLSPSQQRNLEKSFGCRVLDRTGLILDIFALRAHSFEGKLQVELAQLNHMLTRLIKGWTHLERQKGGIGLRGPGETQLETDRRLIQKRILYLKRRLKKVDMQRSLARRLRTKNNIPIVALVGYTNAGKSTLFNQLANTHVYTDDKLFATLDTTLRKMMLPALGEIIIVDTVGFIEDLPYNLIEAFKSTLQETIKADLLLHIIDISDTRSAQKISQVENILAEMSAHHVPSILLMNKIDKLSSFKPKVHTDYKDRIHKIWLSAKTGAGTDLLHEALAQNLSGFMTKASIKLETKSANIRSEIYKTGFVDREKVNKFGEWILEISVTRQYLDKLLLHKGIHLLWEQSTTPTSQI